MIGVFDSGVGGISAFREVRRLLPREDIIYLADRKNAPYGTKSEGEIVALIKKNISRLHSSGAERILIACCSASCLWDRLDEWEKDISLPIITPAAKEAARVGKIIGVISTIRTAESHAFSKEIGRFATREVIEMPTQQLVAMVESGARDGEIDSSCLEYLKESAGRLKEKNIDTLILGCTHFSHLKGEIGRLLRGVRIIDPAIIGAREFVKKIKDRRGCGRSTYTI